MNRPYPAALLLPSDAFDTDQHQVMGRRVAGRSFAQGIAASLHPQEQLCVLAGSSHDLPLLKDLLQPCLPVGSELWLSSKLATEELEQLGCLHLPDPGLAHWCALRAGRQASSFSITGITHTLCSKAVVQGLETLISAPLEPWDALVCTSRAAKAVVEQALEQQLELLNRRFKQQLPRPQGPELPLIPLAIDPTSLRGNASHINRQQERLAARQALGISPDDFVVVFVGRLSFHSKAHPLALYRALADLCDQGPVLLLECGHLYNASIAAAYEQLAYRFPQLKVQRLGGLTPASERDKQLALWAADVFCSPADNLQETFGLSVLEAMAAELPVVASDWNGYRDLVEHGRTGLLIPTADSLHGQVLPDELERHYRLGLIDYDTMVGLRSHGVVVDQHALVQALAMLKANPQGRRRMGEAGLERLEHHFSWRVVAEQYRSLWTELGQRRLAAQASDPGPWPSSSYGALFGHYSSGPLPQHSWRLARDGSDPSLLLEPMQQSFFNRWCPKGKISELVNLLQTWRDTGKVVNQKSWEAAADGLGIASSDRACVLAALQKLGVVERCDP